LLVVIKIIDPMGGKKLRAVTQPTVGKWVGLALQVCFTIPLKTDFDATGNKYIKKVCIFKYKYV
jgi:hypothetical protein